MEQALSKLTVKLTLLTLQGIIFILSQAATTSTTNRTCSNIDLAANTLGKVIVAFFIIFFYLMFFFIFTGAPDWAKYESYGRFRYCTSISHRIEGLFVQCCLMVSKGLSI